MMDSKDELTKSQVMASDSGPPVHGETEWAAIPLADHPARIVAALAELEAAFDAIPFGQPASKRPVQQAFPDLEQGGSPTRGNRSGGRR